MRKILLIALSLFYITASNAEVKALALNKASEKISSTIGRLIPGEGITETSVELKDNDGGRGDIQFSILGVRDILSKEKSNLFTQFSLHTQEINNDLRYVGNLGLGYRALGNDKSLMFGANAFVDQDLSEDHQRVSLGLEAKAKHIDLSYNQYFKSTNQKVISGTKEQALSGKEYNVSSQVPYMPWSTFNLQGYNWENEIAVNNTKGYIYSLENLITPSLYFNIEIDRSSVNGTRDIKNYELVFVHPPREDNKPSLSEQAISKEKFVKRNMENNLKDKVRRNNNLVVEIQGSVTFTSK